MNKEDYMEMNTMKFHELAKAHLGKKPIYDIQFSQDGTRIAVASGIGICIYDGITGRELFLLAEHKRNVTTIIFNLNGCQLTSVSAADSIICLWDVTTGNLLKTLTGVDILSFNPDGHTVVTRDFDDWLGKINLYDISTGTLRKSLTPSSRSVLSAVFSPDGYTLAISSIHEDESEFNNNDDSLLYLWNVATDLHLKTLTVVRGTECPLVFSPDGHILAHGDELTEYIINIKLWDVNTGMMLKDITGVKGYIVDILTFSPDGCILASASGGDDSRIDLWNVETGKLLKTLAENISPISSMCFSPDGRTLATGCEEGAVLLWDVLPETNRTIATADEKQFDIDEINAIAQQIATEDEQYKIEFEQPIETGNAVKLSEGEFMYESLNDGTGAKSKLDNVDHQRSNQIQQVCQERGIETLVHFTRIENLCSILQEGLIGRRLLEAREQQFFGNDADRADGYLDANCLSIGFPNYQMFYSIREGMKSEEVDDSQWIVLLLDAEVLWELDCAFCQRNAASNAVSSIPLDERRKPEALMDMFADFYDIKRQDLPIPQNYPTHPQAEVLVFDAIPTEYIKAIHFWDATTLENQRSNYTGTFSNKLISTQKYFKYRPDFEVWRPKNFNDDGIPLSYSSDGKYVDPDDFDDDLPF